MGLEQIIAADQGWMRRVYRTKMATDANYKRLINLAGDEGRESLQLGIASHNIFDIAYALCLRSGSKSKPDWQFEMLEGMVPAFAKVLSALELPVLLYCPVVISKQFTDAVAYLIRRLDEQQGKGHFLRALQTLEPGNDTWEDQSFRFRRSMARLPALSTLNGYRRQPAPHANVFINIANTDWRDPLNQRLWSERLRKEKDRPAQDIPLCIAGKRVHKAAVEVMDPSRPGYVIYRVSQADLADAEAAIQQSVSAWRTWRETPVRDRVTCIQNAARRLEEKRFDFLALLTKEVAKNGAEGDGEVSEAIDFLDYYARQALQAEKSTAMSGKGPVMIAPPWNFPLSIPTGMASAALLCGNPVLFKPAPEAVGLAWALATLFWEAGIPQEVLQFIPCPEDMVGRFLLRSPKWATVCLTGAADTARHFLKINPTLALQAETGGKNAIIVTAAADKEAAISDIIASAFFFSGQKCSAASLLILEKDVYDDSSFMAQLKDAAESLAVGSAWDQHHRITPLVKPINEDLRQAVSELKSGETWLLRPKFDPDNPQLLHPGIKLGVLPHSPSYRTEYFAPILSVLRAENLDEAIRLANGVQYGLTGGLQSLDQREHHHWLDRVQIGNAYINRPITGAIVGRQPFGGCKDSAFGHGLKAGGPDYCRQFMGQRKDTTPISEQDMKSRWADFQERYGRYLKDDTQAPDPAEIAAALAEIEKVATRLTTLRQNVSPLGQKNWSFFRTREDVAILLDKSLPAIDIALRLYIAHRFKVQHIWVLDDLASDLKFQNLCEQQSISATSINPENLSLRFHEKNIRGVALSASMLRKMKENKGQYLYKESVIHHPILFALLFVQEISVSKSMHRHGRLLPS